MAFKRVYQVGEPCDTCGTPTIPGKFGAYCKPCYIAYAEAKKNGVGYTPKPAESAAPFNFKAIEELQVAIANMRIWATAVEKRVTALESATPGELPPLPPTTSYPDIPVVDREEGPILSDVPF